MGRRGLHVPGIAGKTQAAHGRSLLPPAALRQAGNPSFARELSLAGGVNQLLEDRLEVIVVVDQLQIDA